MRKYHFEKPAITKQSLQEQIVNLKEKLWQSNQQYADTTQPMDNDDLDEIPTGENHDKQNSTDRRL